MFSRDVAHQGNSSHAQSVGTRHPEHLGGVWAPMAFQDATPAQEHGNLSTKLHKNEKKVRAAGRSVSVCDYNQVRKEFKKINSVKTWSLTTGKAAD